MLNIIFKIETAIGIIGKSEVQHQHPTSNIEVDEKLSSSATIIFLKCTNDLSTNYYYYESSPYIGLSK